jgi:hypothetical protein
MYSYFLQPGNFSCLIWQYGSGFMRIWFTQFFSGDVEKANRELGIRFRLTFWRQRRDKKKRHVMRDIIWIAPKKFQNLLRRLAPLTFLIRVQPFRDPLRGGLPHIQIFMNDGPNPLTWDAQLLNYWFSWHPAWIWSIFSGVVTVLGRPGRGASQLEKSPHLNRATQYLSVTYGGAYSPNVSVRMAWIFFGSLN